jgi:hypothetical protein
MQFLLPESELSTTRTDIQIAFFINRKVVSVKARSLSPGLHNPLSWIRIASSMIQFTPLLRTSLLVSPFIVVLLFLSMENCTVYAQQQNQTAQSTRLGAPLAIIPGITGNVLTVDRYFFIYCRIKDSKCCKKPNNTVIIDNEIF